MTSSKPLIPQELLSPAIFRFSSPLGVRSRLSRAESAAERERLIMITANLAAVEEAKKRSAHRTQCHREERT